MRIAIKTEVVADWKEDRFSKGCKFVRITLISTSKTNK
jgi:hypothetical protein